ncbi:MAG: 1-acyl-sn-glycerol-3-phosphate acyltransferase [Clostridia bacterium]|nr:1-acyl-sn-glycerol-3-phosphate acyltransferase [Clostridia bacterium]
MANQTLSVREYGFYDFMKWVCFWPVALYLRPKYIYATKEAKKRIRTAGVVVYNHTSFLDVLYIQLSVWYRRHRIVAEREQLGHGKNRLFLKLLLSIPIDRDSVSPASVRAIVRPLRDGHLIDIFPEGTLNTEPYTLLPFKNGPALFASLGRAPLVPIYIDRGPHFWNRLHFVVGEPLNPEDPAFRPEGETGNVRDALPLITARLEDEMRKLAGIAKAARER